MNKEERLLHSLVMANRGSDVKSLDSIISLRVYALRNIYRFSRRILKGVDRVWTKK
jgi:hypothetical protein